MAQNPGTNQLNGSPKGLYPFPQASVPMSGPISSSQMAAAQQALQNPNGDQYSKDKNKDDNNGWGKELPVVGASWKELGVGAVGGLGLGVATKLLADRSFDHGERLDNLWGVKQANTVFAKVPNGSGWLGKYDWWQYHNAFPDELAKLEKGHHPDHPEFLRYSGEDKVAARVKVITSASEGYHLRRELINLNNTSRSWLTPWSTKPGLGSAEQYAKILNGIKPDTVRRSALEMMGIEEALPHLAALSSPGGQREYFKAGIAHTKSLQQLLSLSAEEQKLKAKEIAALFEKPEFKLYQAAAEGPLRIDDPEKFTRLLEQKPLNLQTLNQTLSKLQAPEAAGHFNDAVLSLKAHQAHLKELQLQGGKDFTKVQRHALRRIEGAHEFLNNSLRNGAVEESIRDHALLQSQIRQKGLKPVGRAYAKMIHSLQNIFGAQALMPGVKASGKFMMAIGMVMAGAFIVAPAIHATNQAEKGEKKAAFFENFLGFGIMNFVGWAVGRRLLNSTQLLRRGLGKNVFKHPFRVFTYMPFIGQRLGEIAGKKMGPTAGMVLGNNPLGKMLHRQTLGAWAGEILAAMGIAQIFQWGGEWVSHKIFGKPTKKDEPIQQAAVGAAVAQASKAKNRALSAGGGMLPNGLPPAYTPGVSPPAYTPGLPPPPYSQPASPAGLAPDSGTFPPMANQQQLAGNPLGVSPSGLSAQSGLPAQAGFPDAKSVDPATAAINAALSQQPLAGLPSSPPSLAGNNPFQPVSGAPKTMQELLQDPYYRRSSSVLGQ